MAFLNFTVKYSTVKSKESAYRQDFSTRIQDHGKLKIKAEFRIGKLIVIISYVLRIPRIRKLILGNRRINLAKLKRRLIMRTILLNLVVAQV